MRILVVGDIIVDKYIYGETKRISPEAPIPVLSVDRTETRLGGAANVAANVKAMGADAILAGTIGNDQDGDKVLKKLNEMRIESLIIKDPIKSTTTKERAISQQQQLLRIDYENDKKIEISNNTLDMMMKSIEDMIKPPDTIILSDYNKGCLKRGIEIINFANSRNIPILVDPKKSDASVYKGCTLIKPNLKEFLALTNTTDESMESLVENANKLMNNNQIKSILITLGGRGMIYIKPGEVVKSQNTRAREVFDVTGAGDTVIAAFAISRTRGDTTEQCLNFASEAAGIAVSRLGTTIVSKEDIQKINKKPRYQTKICGSIEEVITRIEAHKQDNRKSKIVFTNGCFDVLHLGHLEYLEKSKVEGTCLVVAVNSDMSVKRIKGKGRPICEEGDRISLIAGLECVDIVILFKEDTPLNLIKEIKPDVLIKGSDYSIEDIIGASHVMNNGGIVKTIEIVRGRSTTNIIKRIKDT